MPPCPPQPFPTAVFAEVPFPGHPEGITVETNGTVYVATHQDATGGPGVPSHIYAYNRHGLITADFTIKGQDPTGQGLVGLALDHDGLIYALDRHPSRVITVDPRTGEQCTYAELPTVPPCGDSEPDGHCTAATHGYPAFPDDLAFAPDGTLYITDLTQALIWRVPAGGGSAEVWYTSADLDSLFGPNGIRFLDHGRTLLFAQSAHDLHDPAEIPSAQGRLYKLRINSDGTPGERTLLWEGRPGEAPDGFAVGRSGNLYVALALPGALLVLDPQGREITRVPATPEDNARMAPPYDMPASVAFHGDQVLITNQAYFGGPPEHQVVLSVDVHERGKRLFRPRIRR